MSNFGGQKLKGGGQNLNPKMQNMKGRIECEILKEKLDFEPVFAPYLRPLPKKSASEASVGHNPTD